MSKFICCLHLCFIFTTSFVLFIKSKSCLCSIPTGTTNQLVPSTELKLHGECHLWSKQPLGKCFLKNGRYIRELSEMLTFGSRREESKSRNERIEEFMRPEMCVKHRGSHSNPHLQNRNHWKLYPGIYILKTKPPRLHINLKIVRKKLHNE